MMLKKGTSSVFRRMFMLFTAVAAVIYAIIAGLFIQYVRYERQMEESDVLSQVAANAGVIQAQIGTVQNVQYQLSSDPRVAQASFGLFSDAYERSHLLLELVDYIQNTQRVNGVIEDIVLSFPQEGVELSVSRGYDRKDFSDPASYRSPYHNPNQLKLYEGRLETALSYPLPMAVSESYVPDFLIRIVLSEDYLRNSIALLSATEHEGAFWVYSCGEGTILAAGWERDAAVYDGWRRAWKEEQMPRQFARELKVDGVTYFTASCEISDCNLVLVAYQDTDFAGRMTGQMLIYMAAIFIFMAAVFGFLMIWANNSVSQPIRNIIEAFEEVRAGKLNVRVFHKKNNEFDYLYDSFNHTVERIEELIASVREQEALLQQAERMQLQSQINPHFLYNSFYNIKFMAKNEDYEQIESFVTALAKYYRFLNKETDAAIALAGEAQHMENYIEIQQMRFGDIISVDIEKVPEEAAAFRVPKLILQPIVENAYNYGLKNALEGGRLSVKYRLDTDGGFLYIDIEDNGGSMNENKIAALTQQINTFSGEALNHALTNIHRRLLLNYGDGSGLELSVGEGKGLRVRLILNTGVKL